MKFGPLVSGIAALALYLALSPHGCGAGDSSELTLVLAFDGVAHPTGYPLWTIFGHLFGRGLHAAGVSWYDAANAWSALGGAVAVALLHAAARRLIPADRKGAGAAWEVLALAPPALFLLQPAWTGVATVAEVYSWHQAWVHAAVLALLVLLGVGAPPAGDRAVAGWGLLVGAGIAHHATSVLVAIPLSIAVAFFLVADRRRQPGARGLVAKAGAFAAGAALPPAAYLTLLSKSGREGPGIWPALAPGWDGFWRHVTGSQYAGSAGAFAWPTADRALLEGSVYPILAPAVALLVVALVLARGTRNRAALAAIAAAVALQLAFCFRYHVSDPASYFLPALGLSLLALPAVAASVATRVERPRAVIVPAACLVALLAVWLGATGMRAALEERRNLIGLEHVLRRMWAAIPYREGIVLWRNDMAPRLTAFQEFDGLGKGLEVWNPWQFTDPVVRSRFAARHGFDPIGTLALARADLVNTGPESPSAARFFSNVARRIDARVPMPVILFEPEKPDVWVLEKREGSEGATPPR